MRLSQFIEENTITMSATEIPGNPTMSLEMPAGSSHYSCLIRMGKSRMTIPYSMGPGHEGRYPELSDVLRCLISDSSFSDMGIDEFAEDLGYTKVSDAIRGWNEMEKQTRKLKRFFGDDYEEFVSCETDDDN